MKIIIILISLKTLVLVTEASSSFMSFNLRRLRSVFHLSRNKQLYRKRMTRKTTLSWNDFIFLNPKAKQVREIKKYYSEAVESKRKPSKKYRTKSRFRKYHFWSFLRDQNCNLSVLYKHIKVNFSQSTLCAFQFWTVPFCMRNLFSLKNTLPNARHFSVPPQHIFSIRHDFIKIWKTNYFSLI